MQVYFDHEHDPEEIFENGYHRPIRAGEKNVVVTIQFNGDPDEPEFAIHTNEDLSKDEIQDANRSLSRILGTELDLRPLYDQASNDPLLGPLLTSLYGLKRMSRATLFEDTVNRIVEMQMSHKPTAKKMMYRIREYYGQLIPFGGQTLATWPTPAQLKNADPETIRGMGPTRRKGEYISDFAAQLDEGDINHEWLDRTAPAKEFLEAISNVRGIGPTAAQDLMLYRPTTQAYFPSSKVKGEEKGLRKWIILSHGGDPSRTTEAQFEQMIKPWKGCEASAIEFFHMNWVMEYKRRKAERRRQKESQKT
jgi:3-methyladenine DNA glycosylase/8-oxoguanine DNA glycosylase